MLCQFLLYNKVTQLYVYIYPHIPSLLSLPPTLPIPPLQLVTKHQADLPVLCSCFPLAICFTFGSVYMSVLLSHFIPVYPSPSPCPQVHSLCLCLDSWAYVFFHRYGRLLSIQKQKCLTLILKMFLETLHLFAMHYFRYKIKITYDKYSVLEELLNYGRNIVMVVFDNLKQKHRNPQTWCEF